MISGGQASPGLQSRLRRELAAALRARDQVVVAALRTPANTEATPTGPPGTAARQPC